MSSGADDHLETDASMVQDRMRCRPRPFASGSGMPINATKSAAGPALLVARRGRGISQSAFGVSERPRARQTLVWVNSNGAGN
jgi:hypothetical protein